MPRNGKVNDKQKAIYLPEATLERLKGEATQTGLPLSTYIRSVLIRHLMVLDEERATKAQK